MSYLKFALIPLAFLLSCSCSQRYAIVHVVASDPIKGSVGLDIVNAETGYSEGTTPANIIISKASCEQDQTLSLIVYSKCYPAKYVLFKVAKWVKAKKDLGDAVNVTNININVTEGKSCDYELTKK